MALAEHFKKKSIWLRRVTKNGWQDLMRNKLLSAATILIIALMLFVFNIVLALSYATESVMGEVGQKLDISVEMAETAENYSIQAFVENLQKRPEVKEVIFISREEALKKFGFKYPHVISFLDTHRLENPLPNVVRIVSQRVEDNGAILKYLEQPQWNSVVDQEKLKANLEQKTRNEKILDISRFIRKTGFWLNAIFAVVVILIILNSINMNIHSHEQEINVMKLVGAKANFIRGGFLFEGVLYALVALFFSFAFSSLALKYLVTKLLAVISNESLMAGLNAILVHFEDGFAVTLLWQTGTALLVGLISSYLAIELYLRKKHSF
ncbi:FtsX-like permease family protein [Candidatus Peregrinibacteria bacterium]|nr:FtsX-like permease family protein [Candidatus Peregrinibacteria bacterium]